MTGQLDGCTGSAEATVIDVFADERYNNLPEPASVTK
jgi:hypothetical protein